jgi:hypothetical protein
MASSTTVTFEELPPSDWTSTGTSPVVSLGVTFTNFEHRLFITSPNGALYPQPGTGQYLWNFDSGYPVGIFLPAGKTGFAADFSGGIQPHDTFNATLTAILEGGQSYSYHFSGPRGAWTFFGVTFSEPIVGLTYDDGGAFGFHEEMLDNVSFGVAVPEPCGLLLVMLGGVMALWFRLGGSASSRSRPKG